MLASEKFNDFVFHLLGHGVGHVALVDYGYDFQVVVYGHVKVADGLRLYALGGIHHKKRSFASCNTTAHLVREVNVSRSINEIEGIFLAI